MKLGFLLFVLSLILGRLALTLQGIGYLLLWLSADFMLLSVGYFAVGVRIFGKQQDGRIALWAKLLFLPYFMLSHSVWHLSIRLIGEDAFNEISPGLYFGRRLLDHEIPDHFVNYVDLTAEFEDRAPARRGLNYICLPTLDGGIPTFASVHAALNQIKPGATFVHCAQGHGRSAMFALCLLAARGNLQSVEEGEALLRISRPAARLNSDQRRFLRMWIESVKSWSAQTR